ncbi:DUF2255 family protein [Lactococcus sp.]|uniref:DUF2255 family protein n=1 Tax=Lactococcus sp. TaxID=44273 RepID=UPI0035B072BE
MIDVKAFAGIQNIYISPDPQEHRPAWIWFAYIGEDFAVAAGRGEKSSWWQSAIVSKTGQIHIGQQIYQVAFEPVIADEEIDQFISSHKTRAGRSWSPQWEKAFRPTVLRVKFMKQIGVLK